MFDKRWSEENFNLSRILNVIIKLTGNGIMFQMSIYFKDNQLRLVFEAENSTLKENKDFFQKLQTVNENLVKYSREQFGETFSVWVGFCI